MAFGSSSDRSGPDTPGRDEITRMAEEGSQLFLGDLIHSIQSTLDIAADAAERKHAFAMVRFDATATLSFKLNDKADVQDSDDLSSDSETKPKTGFAHRLISLFTRKPNADSEHSREDSGKDDNEASLQESGTITLHMQFQPQRGRSGGGSAPAPATSFNPPGSSAVSPSSVQAGAPASGSLPPDTPEPSTAQQGANPFSSGAPSSEAPAADSNQANANPFA